ncbi:MAG: PhoX family protein [Burkholderiales bacterium]
MENKPRTLVNAANNGATNNPSANDPFSSVLQRYVSRRDVLRGGLGAAAACMLGLPLAGAAADQRNGFPSGSAARRARKLGFESFPGSLEDSVKVPEGYRVQVFVPWGTPINGSSPAFDEVNASNTAAEQAQQVGEHHDGLRYFPFPAGSESSDHGLLVINHEYIDQQYIHNPPFVFDGKTPRTDLDGVRKEINCHGISVLEIVKNKSGEWTLVDSGFNRRITGATAMLLRGPAAGSDLLKTKYSPDGMFCRGTLQDCGMGFTPWGTYLACEENWNDYFVNKNAEQPRQHSRYGVADEATRFGWDTVAGSAEEENDEFARFNATSTGADATEDYRNEPNQFGWVVEIDPYDPSAIPIKRTALGRLAHEGAWVSKVEKGKQLAFYMGDDGRFEYIYKFVTKHAYHPKTAGGFLLDQGTLYAAKFNDDGSGEWLALEFGQNGLNTNAAEPFTSQADVLVNTRRAADVVGATPMDRPEWGTVHPKTGEVYMCLTNNTQRGDGKVGSTFAEQQASQDIGPDAPNPRPLNAYGHIIRWREDGDDPAATTFKWDIFVFGSRADQPTEINLSGLTEDNQFASPDGLWFDPRGILWIQTDDGSNVREATNNQMLAVIPRALGKDGVTPGNQRELRRFLVGPLECEVTGVHMTPDNRNMFVNIQHPGENGDPANPTSTFPGGPGTRPRSTTLVITRENGGAIGG